MKKDPSPYFQFLIDHIHSTWKKKKGFGYPFRGRDFKELKTATRNFQEWQLMALWDVFMESNDEWVSKTGYSVGAFLGSLVWLIDNKSWKQRAKIYQDRIAPLPIEISRIIKQL
jgi:hypothetical protein